MERPNSLTITSARAAYRAAFRAARAWRPLIAAAALGLAGCTVEVGPPPESDPPLVPQSARVQPPAQPTEPQAWSRDLDFESGPTRIERGELAEGLVATDTSVNYSEQRLTYQSAFQEERRLTQAEQARQRAMERAAAAGLPPPPAVAPPPVEQVSAEPLPPAGAETSPAPTGAETSQAPRRESRLPPPPKFPPLQPAPQTAEAAAEAAPEAAAAAPAATPEAGTPEAAAPEPEMQQAAVQQAAAEPAEVREAEAAAFVAEAWDAPSGTILVQVSAVPDEGKVVAEWQRLQDRYPQVLKPLRLVVDEARLGERGVFYRVQAGAFGSEAGAAEACDALIGLGQACFVVVR